MPPIDINVTTMGAALLSLAIPASVVLWKRLPTKRSAKYTEVDFAVLKVQVSHIGTTVNKIEKDVKEINRKLR